MINQMTKLEELSDRKARDRYCFYLTCCRINHPVWEMKVAAVRLPDQVMTNAVMLVDAGSGLPSY